LLQFRTQLRLVFVGGDFGQAVEEVEFAAAVAAAAGKLGGRFLGGFEGGRDVERALQFLVDAETDVFYLDSAFGVPEVLVWASRDARLRLDAMVALEEHNR
jgi:hypothetical protein